MLHSGRMPTPIIAEENYVTVLEHFLPLLAFCCQRMRVGKNPLRVARQVCAFHNGLEQHKDRELCDRAQSECVTQSPAVWHQPPIEEQRDTKPAGSGCGEDYQNRLQNESDDSFQET